MFVVAAVTQYGPHLFGNVPNVFVGLFLETISETCGPPADYDTLQVIFYDSIINFVNIFDYYY